MIDIHICNKDRPTELALLLQSLMNQTYKEFQIIILDDGSSTPISSYYFLQYLIQRIKINGNNVIIVRNEIPSGVSKARQQLVNWSLENSTSKYFARIDDDSICDKEYLHKLLLVIDEGYDIAGGVVPHIADINTKRNIKNVEPIIGYCELDDIGELIVNFDDCGTLFNEEKILPSPHFRSSALFKREVFENGVSYNNRLSKNGFREEQWISWLAILKGFKIGINTGAINWHLATPSGGERDTMNMTKFNQDRFEEFTKEIFLDKGDFLKDYYINTLKVTPRKVSDLEKLKSTNLVSIKKEVGLI